MKKTNYYTLQLKGERKNEEGREFNVLDTENPFDFIYLFLVFVFT